MDENQFKKILIEALKPINDKLDSHTEILEGHSERLQNHSGALISIENKLDAYGDMYKINDGNIRKLDKRLDLLEEDSGVEVPPEMQLTDVA